MNAKTQEKSRMANLMESIKLLFTALSVNDGYIANPEEEVKKSGNEELIKESENIKKLEAMFKDKETSKSKLKNIDKTRSASY